MSQKGQFFLKNCNQLLKCNIWNKWINSSFLQNYCTWNGSISVGNFILAIASIKSLAAILVIFLPFLYKTQNKMSYLPTTCIARILMSCHHSLVSYCQVHANRSHWSNRLTVIIIPQYKWLDTKKFISCKVQSRHPCHDDS